MRPATVPRVPAGAASLPVRVPERRQGVARAGLLVAVGVGAEAVVAAEVVVVVVAEVEVEVEVVVVAAAADVNWFSHGAFVLPWRATGVGWDTQTTGNCLLVGLAVPLLFDFE